MYLNRNQKITLNKQKILAAAERLLIDNDQDIVIGDLAKELDIAKGTIYKYFKSKNQLYLELLIENEKRILDLSKKYKTNMKENVEKYMLYHMLNSSRTILFHSIEERIAGQDKKLKDLFNSLYMIREERILELNDLIENFLYRDTEQISVRDYLFYVWTLTYGASLLLSSTGFQMSINERERIINFHIKQAYMLSSVTY
ncbi:MULTISPECIES: helix-turn-helix domain-containing protein [unclassified Acinetobacter]|uniref:TetR/AcrR family transcriptional regulator n=1 Tax=unclassified Acinetobacter TaxID=196816 RepID=UPI002934C46A|nr:MULTISPECIES: helix-turn-helix domain-containing protein [unclassified Acinetobacter]WOE32932.1 helix-turn-helix domain-containing protein [Acinetobacter sp. SAAs470]WOE38409.1 helix-turn-helix domain-containing protein [Acinetobacter sp. SAAs474]